MFVFFFLYRFKWTENDIPFYVAEKEIVKVDLKTSRYCV